MTDMIVKPAFRSASIALNGTTHVTLLAAPKEGESYFVRHVYGFNTSSGSRRLFFYINKASVVPRIWSTISVPIGGQWIGLAGFVGDPPTIGIVLADTDESLEINIDSTGTDVVWIAYEVGRS